MHRFKRSLAVTLCLLFIATPCLAEESALKTILKDTAIGVLSGGFVGAVVMAFAKKPASHLDLIGYGAGAGAVVGAAYGSVVASRALAEVENGAVKFGLPTIRPQIRETNSKGQTAFVASAELIRGSF